MINILQSAMSLEILRPTPGSNVHSSSIAVFVSGSISGLEKCLLISGHDRYRNNDPPQIVVSESDVTKCGESTAYAYLTYAEKNVGPHTIKLIADGKLLAFCPVNLCPSERGSLSNANNAQWGSDERNKKVIWPLKICRCEYSNWNQVGDSIRMETLPRSEFTSAMERSDANICEIAPNETIDGTRSIDTSLSIGIGLPAFQSLLACSRWSPGTTYLASFRNAIADIKNGIVLFGNRLNAWGDSCVATVLPQDGRNRSPYIVPFNGQLAWVPGDDFGNVTKSSQPSMMVCHWASVINYGHWMMNSLFSAYCVLKELQEARLCLVCPELSIRHRYELYQLGVPSDSIVETASQYVNFDRLVYPSPLSTRSNIQPSTFSLSFFAYVKERFKASFNYIPPECIFVTRKGVPTLRRMVNEEQLIQAMMELGLKFIAPHELSFAEQIYAFSNAKLIVGQLGAALWNLPFGRRDGCVVEICTTNYTTNEYFYISHLMNHRFVRVMVSPQKEGGGSFDFSAPIEELRRIVTRLRRELNI